MKKLYYSMGEVSKLTGLAPHVLRSWEKNYKELNPKKNSAGNRAYKEEEVELIFKIKELVEDKKYTSAGVKKVLKSDSEPSSVSNNEITADVKRDLNEMKIFLNELLEKL
ncbi:MAG: MerR family transcriptional regulator [Balneola sp.]